MVKNDYRRALIMLRGLRPGLSGYIRLERRTLIGTMQFTVNGVTEGETFYALLLHRRNDQWNAVMLDRFGPVRYGQSGLVYRFDPRNIEGKTLEQYQIAAVASIRDNTCDLALSGFLNGSVEADWPQIREKVCALFSSAKISENPLEEQAAGMPVPSISVFSDETENTENTDSPDGEPFEPFEASIEQEENPEQDGEVSPAEIASDQPVPVPSSETDAFDRPAGTSLQGEELGLEQTEQMDDEFDRPAAPDFSSLTADDELALAIEKPWPDSIEPLRSLFRTRKTVHPFDETGFVMIRVPIAMDAGPDRCVVGIACREGRPVRALYGIPARFTPEPPSDLTDCVWRGDQREGFWVAIREIE